MEIDFKVNELPTQKYLKESFSYNPLNGLLTRNIGKNKGKIVGADKGNGYLTVWINPSKKRFKVQDLIWKIVTGETRKTSIENKDGDKKNNKWENLFEKEKTKVCGVGYNSEGKYKKCINNLKTESFLRWHSMLSRCYDGKQSAYLNCFVNKDWHDFQNFAEWFESNFIRGWDLDKDLLGNGFEYSSENCCFLPREFNSLLSSESNGVKHTGYSLVGHKYYVRVRDGSPSQKYIGKFDTIEEASCAYKEAKQERVLKLLNKYRGQLSMNIYNKICERFEI